MASELDRAKIEKKLTVSSSETFKTCQPKFTFSFFSVVWRQKA